MLGACAPHCKGRKASKEVMTRRVVFHALLHEMREREIGWHWERKEG